jgi:hypothetical protein
VTTTKALYADYSEWARREVRFAVSAIALGRDLVARGFEKTKVGPERGLRGLKLRGPEREELPLPERKETF